MLWGAKMAKMLVSELAKELNCTNKELLTALEQLQIKVESHLSSLDEGQVNTIKKSNLVFEGRYLVNDAFMKAWEAGQAKLKNSLSHNHRELCQGETIDLTDEVFKRMSQRFNIPKRNPDIAQKPLEGKRIEIRDGETGHTYENLFGDYLRNAKSVVVEDKWIRYPYQIKNFMRFCIMLEKMGKVGNIHLITGFHDDVQKKAFKDLQDSLNNYNISLSYEFSDEIHDRDIKTDDGWVIDPGRGLDIYKPPESWYTIEAEDYERRACRKTTINISKLKT